MREEYVVGSILEGERLLDHEAAPTEEEQRVKYGQSEDQLVEQVSPRHRSQCDQTEQIADEANQSSPGNQDTSNILSRG